MGGGVERGGDGERGVVRVETETESGGEGGEIERGGDGERGVVRVERETDRERERVVVKVER